MLDDPGSLASYLKKRVMEPLDITKALLLNGGVCVSKPTFGFVVLLLCCVVLCCVVLCCMVLCCVILFCCVVLCCIVLCCVVLFCCVVLCCGVLCCVVVLCCGVLCCVVLCYFGLFWFVFGFVVVFLYFTCNYACLFFVSSCVALLDSLCPPSTISRSNCAALLLFFA